MKVQSPPQVLRLAAARLIGKTVLFSLDQSFGNGMTADQDTVGLQRIITTLKAFQAKYQLYVLLNPMIADKNKLKNILDTLSASGIPFVFDIPVSSDVLTHRHQKYGGVHVSLRSFTWNLAFARSGKADLYKKTTYGSSFAGIRFREVYFEDFTI